MFDLWNWLVDILQQFLYVLDVDDTQEIQKNWFIKV